MIDTSQFRKVAQLDGIEERNQACGDRLGSGEQIKAKRARKSGRETVERDDQPGSVGGANIASEPFLPGQTPMCALRSGQGWRDLRRGR